MLIEGIDYRRSRGVDDNPLFRQYITLRPHSVTSARLGLRVEIEPGYFWDGPSGLGLVSEDDFALFRASLFHDALYEPEGMVRVECDQPVTKRLADSLFFEIARQDRASWLHLLAAWLAFKTAAWAFWEDRTFPQIGD